MQHDHPGILIIGGGSAGRSCAAELLKLAPGARITIVDSEPGGPINRMLVTKGVLPGLLGPELIAQPPLPAAERVEGHAVALLRDAETGAARGVRLADGTELTADAVVVASGSTARPLSRDIDVDPGVVVRTVQTAADAVALREALAAVATAAAGRPEQPEGAASEGDEDRGSAARPRLLVIGAGFIGTEVANHFNGSGVDAIVLGRTAEPLVGAFGRPIAERLGELHREHGALLGVEVRAVRARTAADGEAGSGSGREGVVVELGDGSIVEGDAVVAAVGVAPASGWAGVEGGLPVDGGLRVRVNGTDEIRAGLYAAGGAAAHELGGERVVIDHWDAAAEQGAHAARAILADLGLGEDPGAYLPRSGFTLQAYATTFAGHGYRANGSEDREVEGVEPALPETAVVTELVDRQGTLTGLAGLNAGAALRGLLERIGTKR